MKKRVLFVLLALVMCLELLPAPAFAADDGFTIENGVLVKYNGPGGDVVIPEGVTEIGFHAFESCTTVASVVIPEGVTTIGASAFQSCTGLTSVNIPTAVTIIGGEAFEGCPNLENVYYSGTQEQREQIAFADGNNNVNKDTPIRTACVTHSYGAGVGDHPGHLRRGGRDHLHLRRVRRDHDRSRPHGGARL